MVRLPVNVFRQCTFLNIKPMHHTDSTGLLLVVQHAVNTEPHHYTTCKESTKKKTFIICEGDVCHAKTCEGKPTQD